MSLTMLVCQHCGSMTNELAVPCGCEPSEHPQYASCMSCFDHMEMLESNKYNNEGAKDCPQCKAFKERKGGVLGIIAN